MKSHFLTINLSSQHLDFYWSKLQHGQYNKKHLIKKLKFNFMLPFLKVLISILCYFSVVFLHKCPENKLELCRFNVFIRLSMCMYDYFIPSSKFPYVMYIARVEYLFNISKSFKYFKQYWCGICDGLL